ADWIGGVFFVAKLLHVLIIHGNNSGKADDLPAGLVPVAAVDRVGEQPFYDGLIHRGKKKAGGRAVFERHPARLEAQEKFLALALGDFVETLAVGLDAKRIGRCNAGTIQLRWCERNLISLARHAFLPWTLHIKALAFAPAAGKRAIDVDVDSDIGALG